MFLKLITFKSSLYFYQTVYFETYLFAELIFPHLVSIKFDQTTY